MCLTVSSNARVRTVKRERTVYKIMAIRKENENYLYSPFRLFPVEMGKLYDIEDKIVIDKYDEVEEGFHSFKSYEVAKEDLLDDLSGYIEARDTMKLVIVECKIPVGSKIVKGMFAGMESYVSDKIKYVKTLFETSIKNYDE